MNRSAKIIALLLSINFLYSSEEPNRAISETSSIETSKSHKDFFASLRRQLLEKTHGESVKKMTDEQILQTINDLDAKKKNLEESLQFQAQVSKELTQISGLLDQVQQKKS
jgi:predicted secreted Zn-dependent protease